MSVNKEILIKSVNLGKYFPLKKSHILQRETKYLKANDSINLDIYKGETLGLVGESGCGKSTFGRTLIQLQNQDAGASLYYGQTLYSFKPQYVKKAYQNLVSQFKSYRVDANPSRADETMLRLCGGLLVLDDLAIVSKELLKSFTQGKDTVALIELKQLARKHEHYQEFETHYDDGIDLTQLSGREMRRLRQELQIIFQNPYSSLDPRMSVGKIIAEGVVNFKGEIPELEKNPESYIKDIMAECGLDADLYTRYPHQFSGGQRQRVSIARTLAVKPKFIVCDESVSALDVSIQAQVLKLLEELKKHNDLTYLFITHDLGVVRYISDRIGVMYFGHLVELAPTQELFQNPQHPYTKKLLAAVPHIDFEMKDEGLEAVEPIEYPHISFDFVYDRKGNVDPDWVEVSKGHFVACIDKREVRHETT